MSNIPPPLSHNFFIPTYYPKTYIKPYHTENRISRPANSITTVLIPHLHLFPAGKKSMNHRRPDTARERGAASLRRTSPETPDALARQKTRRVIPWKVDNCDWREATRERALLYHRK